MNKHLTLEEEFNPMTIAEEIYSLAVGETSGSLSHTHDVSFKVALAGAVLINLAIKERIDTDLEGVFLGTGELTMKNDMDLALIEIIKEDEKRPVKYWIEYLIKKNDVLNDMLLNSLIQQGILKIENKQILWVFSSRRYPLMNNRKVTEVKARIRDLIFSDELPDVRDLSIVSVLFYSGTLDMVLSEDEITSHFERIEMIAKMDLIGQEINKSILTMTRPRHWFNRIKI